MTWRDTYEAKVSLTLLSVGGLRHLRVTRIDGRDGIPWDDLQVIKNELLGEDVLAVEIYPPAAQLVNELNMRHLWEVGSAFAQSLPNLNGRW